MKNENYLVTGNGVFNKLELRQLLFDWGYENPDYVLIQIDKLGSVKLGKHKICKFR